MYYKQKLFSDRAGKEFDLSELMLYICATSTCSRSVHSVRSVELTLTQSGCKIWTERTREPPTNPPFFFTRRSLSHPSTVDVVQPDILLRTSRVSADTQDLLQLSRADEEDASRDEEANAFLARRAGKTASVGPELVEPVDLTDSLVEIDVYVAVGRSVVEADSGRKLFEER